MAARCLELIESRRLRFDPDDPGTSLEFIVVRATSESDAAVNGVGPANAPYRFQNFTRLKYTCESMGGGVYRVSVPYGVPAAGSQPALFPGETLSAQDQATDPAMPNMTSPYPEGTSDPFGDYPAGGTGQGSSPAQPASDTDAIGPEWGFDTSGGTKKITAALIDAKRGGAPSRYFSTSKLDTAGNVISGPVTDYQGLLGVAAGDQGKLTVEGIEAVNPVLVFSTTRTVRAISLRYINLVARMTGSVNSKPFAGYKAGELQFLGASGQYRPGNGTTDPGAWSISYKFQHQPSLVAPPIQPTWLPNDPRRLGLPLAKDLYLPAGQTKDGWDLLEIYFKDVKDVNLGVELPTAVGFSISRVFERTDFRWLGFRNFGF